LNHDRQNPSLFSFEPEAHGVAEDHDAAASRHEVVPDLDALQRMRRSIEAVDETTYHWIIETDQIKWSPNIAKVLECSEATASSGRAYANLLDGDNITSRYDTVMRSHATDDGDGVPFQIEYLFRPEGRDGRRAIWLEDHGKWYADQSGRPVEVYGTIRRIDDRHSRDQHLSFLGNCDPLTGMMNRGRLSEALNETLAMATREQTNCAFLIAAVNNLPVVNDAYGFEVADEVIVALGRRLRQVVRTGDAIARYSGSKFGIILNNCNEDDVAIAVNRFINIARESVIETEHGPVWAMLSIGAVVVPKHAADANVAMARAEEALTEARRLPSDGSVIYRPSVQRAAERSLNARCATEIVNCLKEDQFKLAYQPIVSAATHEVVMHEALLRMNDSNNELIAAAHLIPVAEKLGLVRLIDRAVAHLTIAALHAHPQAHLSMNVSGATATDPRWFNQLTDIIRANTDVAHRLTVEITETVALGNMMEAFGFVEALRNLGCSVAIDDFGAGFTSFRNLRDLPVNIIKLDGGFCKDLAHNSSNQYLVRTLVDLGHKFNLKVIGEWVETEEDLAVLNTCNVDFLQGNLFGAASLTLPWPRSEPVLDGSFQFPGSGFEMPTALDLSIDPDPAPMVSVPEPEPEQATAVAIPDPAPEPAEAAEAPKSADSQTSVNAEEAPAAAPLIAHAETPAPEPEAPEPYSPDMEDGLSKLRLAIQALDRQFRNTAASPDDPLPQQQAS
jgi:diguanylate cyclase (GGDEF)-like protein